MNQKKLTEIAYLLLRVVAGFMFFQAGALKIFGWYGGMPPAGASAELMTQIGIGGLMELVGGVMIALGLFTRPVAFILSGEMAVAYWQFHSPMGTWPIVNHGEGAVLYCFIFLYMAALGGGDYSLEAVIRRKRS